MMSLRLRNICPLLALVFAIGCGARSTFGQPWGEDSLTSGTPDSGSTHPADLYSRDIQPVPDKGPVPRFDAGGPSPDLGPFREGVAIWSELLDGATGQVTGAFTAMFGDFPVPYFAPVQQLSPECYRFNTIRNVKPQYSAGPLTLQVMGGTAVVLTLPPQPGTSGGLLYPSTDLLVQMPPSGSAFRVVASGSPDFGPITTPVETLDFPLKELPLGTVRRGQALTVPLGAVGSDTERWVLLQSEQDSSYHFRCIAAATNATGTTTFLVPAAVTQWLPRGPVFVGVAAVRVNTTTEGRRRLHVVATRAVGTTVQAR